MNAEIGEYFYEYFYDFICELELPSLDFMFGELK